MVHSPNQPMRECRLRLTNYNLARHQHPEGLVARRSLDNDSGLHALTSCDCAAWRQEGEPWSHRCEFCCAPWLRYCMDCGLRMLLLRFHAREWVSRRVERVQFNEDRTVARRVGIDFEIPPQAPVYESITHRQRHLLPLALLKRQTLVGFELRDERDRSVPVLSLRENQQLTESLIAAWAAEALCLERPVAGRTEIDARSQSVYQFIHLLVCGEQRDLLTVMAMTGDRRAQEALKPNVLPVDAALSDYCANRSFGRIVRRFADNWLLFALVTGGGFDRHHIRMRYEEPLTVGYREPLLRTPRGIEDSRPASNSRPISIGDTSETLTAVRETRKRLRAQVPAAMGWSSYDVLFPVPSAEAAESFHFELETPRGVRVKRARFLAGLPNDASSRPSFDLADVDSPLVGLHAVDVPPGSVSMVSVSFHALSRGWLLRALLSCVAVTGLLFVTLFSILPNLGSGGAMSPEAPFIVLIGIAGVVASLVAQSEARGVGARMLGGMRFAVALVAAFPLVAAVALTALDSKNVGHPVVKSLLIATLVCSGLVTGFVIVAWLSARFAVTLPELINRMWLRCGKLLGLPRGRPSHQPVDLRVSADGTLTLLDRARLRFGKPLRLPSYSPWAQGVGLRETPRPASFTAGVREFGLNKPAAVVMSAEGIDEVPWAKGEADEMRKKLFAALSPLITTTLGSEEPAKERSVTDSSRARSWRARRIGRPRGSGVELDVLQADSSVTGNEPVRRQPPDVGKNGTGSI